MRRKKLLGALAGLAIVGLIGGIGPTSADELNVQNAAELTPTFTAGAWSVTADLKLSQKNENADGQNQCNAEDGTAATVTVNVPAGVTAVPSTFTIDSCANNVYSVTYSATVAGTYAIPQMTLVDQGSTPKKYGLGGDSIGATFFGTYDVSATAFSFVASNPVIADTTGPVIVGTPADIVAEATGAAGATVTYTPPTATDNVDASVSVSCTPASGSVFPLGTTTVTCTATDAAGNSSSVTFTVTVEDTTPPAIGSVTNLGLEATGATGAIVTYTAPTATDTVAGSVPVTCTPASGSTFPLGTTTVTCSATDGTNSASKTFDVTIKDTTAPALVMPSAVTVEATSPSGAVATFSGSANDLVNGSLPLTCTPPSGSTFALGGNTVTCTAVDAAGNSASDTFTVTVVDTTPPALTVTAPAATEATSAVGAAVSFGPFSASDAVSGSIPASCSPASGTTFALGDTTVTCSAADAAGNSSSASFTVTVVDTTAPVINAADVVATGTNASGATVTFAPTATDLVSGSVPVVCTPASGSTFAYGATPVSCTATDGAGNVGTGSFVVTVSFAVCGTGSAHAVGQPINANGSSVFKLGSTVPVKLRICDSSGRSIGSPGAVVGKPMLVGSGSAGTGTVNEDVVSTTPDTAFRFDAVDGQWIFNLSTKNLKGATKYWYEISLIDGSKVPFQFTTK
jgi:hypothetical protein